MGNNKNNNTKGPHMSHNNATTVRTRYSPLLLLLLNA